MCLNGRVGGIHFGVDGKKETGSDRNTEGERRDEGRSCFPLSHLLISLIMINHSIVEKPCDAASD